MNHTNKAFAALLLTTLAGLSTGCATSQPYVMNYNDNKSLALNIVNNAGINPYGNIKDTEVPVGVKKHIANTGEYGALNSALKYSFPCSGQPKVDTLFLQFSYSTGLTSPLAV